MPARSSQSLIAWVGRTLAGHLVFLEVTFALPMFLYFLNQKAESHEPVTLGWVSYTLAVTVGMAAILAALCWYTLTRPLIATYSKRK
jgi:hypothetical protein